MNGARRREIGILFLTMMKIGAFTFGGGYAMLSLLQTEFTEKRGWLTEDEFLDMAAIAESTPGPIAINAATYIGYRRAGFFGSLAATVGVVLPSFVIIYLISLFFDAFLSLTVVANAFRGIQVCVVWLILSAGIRMLKKAKKTPLTLTILSLTILLMVTLGLLGRGVSTVFYILVSGAVGFFFSALAHRKGEGKK